MKNPPKQNQSLEQASGPSSQALFAPTPFTPGQSLSCLHTAPGQLSHTHNAHIRGTEESQEPEPPGLLLSLQLTNHLPAQPTQEPQLTGLPTTQVCFLPTREARLPRGCGVHGHGLKMPLHLLEFPFKMGVMPVKQGF